MKKLFALIMLLSMTSHAEGLRSTALQELTPTTAATLPATNQKSASKASSAKATPSISVAPGSNSLIFNVEDPYHEPRVRNFRWDFGVLLQNYVPRGQVETSTVTENLAGIRSTVMPSISMGALYRLNTENLNLGAFELGAQAQVGYATQPVSLHNLSGNETQGQLNSLMTEIRSDLRWSQSLESKWHGKLGLGMGRLNLTQTSDNSSARWSRTGSYNAVVLGLNYDLNHRWSVMGQQKFMSAKSDWPGEVELASSQFELGTEVLW